MLMSGIFRRTSGSWATLTAPRWWPLALLCCVASLACASTQAPFSPEERSLAPLAGRNRADVRQAMGKPARLEVDGQHQVWTYYSRCRELGASRVRTFTATDLGMAVSRRSTGDRSRCLLTLLYFDGDRLERYTTQWINR